MGGTHDITLRAATAADAQDVACRLRAQDMAELMALKVDPLQGVLTSFEESTWCEVIERNGRPAAIFGVCPSKTDQRLGVPWMVGTQDMERVGSFFVRGCRPMLERTLNTFPALANVTHRDNSVSRRWLTWLGFQFAHPRDGRPFVGFWAAKPGHAPIAIDRLERVGFNYFDLTPT
jgi:hypothetical protein